MYGYEDLGLIFIESMFRPTGPGGLTECTQADYYVRSHLLGLANGVELFGACANLCDVGNVYHHSQYGTVGLCHRAPELNPKESYVAYATMTSVLDRAEYLEYLDTGSTSVWALRFRNREGRNVYALWTINGQRDLTLELSGDADAVVIDAMHNQRPVSRQGRMAQLTVNSSPVYLRTGLEITSIEPGSGRYSEAPPRNARASTILPSDRLSPSGTRSWRRTSATARAVRATSSTSSSPTRPTATCCK